MIDSGEQNGDSSSVADDMPTRRGAARGMSQEVAFEQIRDLIVTGKLAPGSWVVEADLADRLGLSRTPIRGALHLLQNEGYAVEHRSGTKTRVLIAPLTMDDAHELYEIVARVESLTAKRLADMPAGDVSALADRLESINAAIHDLAAGQPATGQDASRARRVFDLDTSFHKTFVEAAAGPRLLALHRSVKPQIERYWRLYASTIMNGLHVTAREHGDIITAIQQGDAEAIERAVEANWTGGYQRIVPLIELLGERGSW
jgi:DNA-binding GntR family transcriptional regulator